MTTARRGSTSSTGTTRRAFEKVSWAFVDPYVEQTLAHRGWWRTLPAERRQAIALEFWQVGRLTLEHWLMPRLDPAVVHSRPRTQVTAVDGADPGRRTPGPVGRDLLEVDHVIVASGYRADLAAVPYLAGVLDRVSVTDGFPDLSPGFETTLPGPVRHRFRGHPRLRAVLRLHQGLPVRRPDRGRRDAALRALGRLPHPIQPARTARRRFTGESRLYRSASSSSRPGSRGSDGRVASYAGRSMSRATATTFGATTR